MKIQEILSEGPAAALGAGAGKVSNVAGQAVGQLAGAAGVFHKGFKQGQAKMDKILSPSKWFDKTPEEPGKKQTVPDYEYRRSLNTAVKNTDDLLQRDQSMLQQLRQDVKSGQRKFDVDSQQLSLALKAAVNKQPLDKNQRALLQQVANTL